MLIGGFLGYSAGVATGITLVGNRDGGRGSFAWTLGGTMIGGAVAVVAGAATGSPEAAIAAGLTLPVLGGLIAYWSTHHHDDAAPTIGGLLQVSEGRAGVGIPLPTAVTTGTQRTPGLVLAAGTF